MKVLSSYFSSIADPEREQRDTVAAHEDDPLGVGRVRAEQHALRPHLQRHHRRRHRRGATHQQGQLKGIECNITVRHYNDNRILFQQSLIVTFFKFNHLPITSVNCLQIVTNR